VLELDVEAELARRFPHDLVAPVAKGARGADLIHQVRDAALRSCGTIVWETKNNRHWHAGWLDKLKEDQRAVGANLAVIVSIALPDGIVEFAAASTASGSPACAPGPRWRSPCASS